MRYTDEQIAELDILINYSLESTQQGIKVHSNANEEVVDAVERLFDKGLVTQIDGGYLTDIGRKAAETRTSTSAYISPTPSQYSELIFTLSIK